MNPVEKLQETVAEAIEEFSEFTLSKPVKNIDGSLVKKVKIKTDFNGGDIETIANVGSDKEGTWLIALVSNATKLPMAVVRSMSAKDVKGIASVAKNFLGDGESDKEE